MRKLDVSKVTRIIREKRKGTPESALAVLEEAITNRGKPASIMTDHPLAVLRQRVR